MYYDSGKFVLEVSWNFLSYKFLRVPLHLFISLFARFLASMNLQITDRSPKKAVEPPSLPLALERQYQNPSKKISS